MGLFGVAGEFARHGDDLFARHAGDLFGPGGGVGGVVVEILRHPVAAKTAVQPVVRAEQVKDRGDRRPCFRRPASHGGRGCCGSAPRARRISRKRRLRRRRNRGNRRRRLRRDAPSRIWLRRSLRLGPGGLCPPGSTCPPRPSGTRSSRWARHRPRCLVKGDGLPVGVVRLAQLAFEILGPQHAARDKAAVLFVQHHQHRHVGVFAGT
jgi:hypothetical protein